MKIELLDLNLPLLHRFAISRGGTDEVRTIWVRVFEDEIEGWGEAAAVKYKNQTRESMRRALESISHQLALVPVEKALQDWDSLTVQYSEERGALAGLNMALWDWVSKTQQIPLRDLWQAKEFNSKQLFNEFERKALSLKRINTVASSESIRSQPPRFLNPHARSSVSPPSSFTIGVDTPEIMSQKVVEAERFPILKVKLGFKGDLEVFELLQSIAPHKKWRVDANGGWGLNEAIEKSKRLEQWGIELVEQPITSSNPEDFRRIQEAISIPLYLDESVDGIEDLEKYQGSVQGVNLKLAKIGSLTRLHESILCAKELGYQVMLGCMTCSSLHIAGILPLSPLADTLDLDGHLLLRSEPFSGLKLNHDGAFHLTDQCGVGLEFDPRKM